LDRVRRGTWRRARAESKALEDKAAHAAGPARKGPRKPGRPKGSKTRPPERQAAADKAKALRSARWPLLKNPENLTEKQQAKLAYLESADPLLHRAYRLKEALRYVFHAPAFDEAEHALSRFLSWAARCRIPEFVDLGRSVRAHSQQILNSLRHKLSNGRIESANAKLRVITRMAFGFHNVQSMIGLAMLSLGGHPPTLPGRN
jgi:transposase